VIICLFKSCLAIFRLTKPTSLEDLVVPIPREVELTDYLGMVVPVLIQCAVTMINVQSYYSPSVPYAKLFSLSRLRACISLTALQCRTEMFLSGCGEPFPAVGRSSNSNIFPAMDRRQLLELGICCPILDTALVYCPMELCPQCLIVHRGLRLDLTNHHI
jgi:hypothetical protein